MIRISDISGVGFDLQDETKEISENNKIKGFHFFGKCQKCKMEKELSTQMFTDFCVDSDGCSFTGWKYKCTCGRIIQVWEGTFDSIIESAYDADLVEESEW